MTNHEQSTPETQEQLETMQSQLFPESNDEASPGTSTIIVDEKTTIKIGDRQYEIKPTNDKHYGHSQSQSNPYVIYMVFDIVSQISPPPKDLETLLKQFAPNDSEQHGQRSKQRDQGIEKIRSQIIALALNHTEIKTYINNISNILSRLKWSQENYDLPANIFSSIASGIEIQRARQEAQQLAEVA